MMRLSDFILLHKEEKKMILLHRSTLIAKRSDGINIIFLFQLGSFYVEMSCNIMDKKVEEYRAFKNTSLLEPYLETIRISDIFDAQTD
jgi:hypothetical protein